MNKSILITGASGGIGSEIAYKKYPQAKGKKIKTNFCRLVLGIILIRFIFLKLQKFLLFN